MCLRNAHTEATCGSALHSMAKRAVFAISAFLATNLLGCAGYQLGHQALFLPEVRTIYVPVFQSDVYRRQLGEWLTEAVVRQIELRTPYKVVHTPDADTVLYGRIVSEQKHVLAEDRNDNPRDIAFDLVVEIRWVDRSGNTVLRSATLPVDLSLMGTGHFIPEGGQSLATAQQAIIRNLAARIVDQLEAGW
ncbi:MAG: hypothetical protein KatS3mg110_4046 [Pirellulaceae bacterium]|nr:MAG: hypothetical protein KatS3mg110_4046 [Pirellulaceae bacterium]